ncbi:hypothetical protein ACVBCQ_003823, partial [Escherichia albertii]
GSGLSSPQEGDCLLSGVSGLRLLVFLVSDYDAFVLRLSVSIVLDSHDSSVAVSFRFEVLSPAPGGRMSKLQDHLLHTV